ncbi:serine hydrolase domain-containing protein [Streptomyces sp. NPDC047097]|uniref:serine hydrolase domain-containing protein n=1 Tax=Streptomyces sp. NPDC047097 TaxID=3155260 RepID=UPI0033F3A0A2
MPVNTRIRIRTAVAVALLAGLLAGGTAHTATAAPAVPAAQLRAAATGPDVAALERAIAQVPDDDVTAALIRVGGDGSWTGTAGLRSRHTGAAATQDLRFRAGSTTKVVTASIVLQLVAEGRVELDAPVTRYLPGLLPASFTEPPTVRHLLTWTSGLKAGAALGDTPEEMYAQRFRTLTPQRVVATAVAKGPAFTPGERQVYQNIDYTVLGLLIERVTGDRYAHQAEVRVLRPLGMRDTGFPAGPDPVIHGPHLRAYAEVGGRTVDVTEWNMSDRWAAGDMISTTADLEKLVRGLFGGRVVPRPLLDRMLTLPDVEGATHGMGLQRFVHDNGTVIWAKTGSRPGYHTVLAAARDANGRLTRTVVYSVTARSARDDGLGLASRFALPAFNR